MTKNFAAAAKEYDETEDDLLEFSLNGEGDYLTYLPTSTQIALYSAAFAGDTEDPAATMAATMRFIKESFTSETYSDVVRRLHDRNEPEVSLEMLLEVIRWLFEEAAARPTNPSSSSASSQQRGGRTLTDHLPPKASTRSRSPRAASAT